jgi:hypothetical protein
VIAAIDHVLKTAKKVGVAPGIHTSGVEGINMRIAQGFQYLALASESRYLLASLTEALHGVNWTASERDTPSGAGGEVVRY